MSRLIQAPRVVIAGLSGDAGKTLVSLMLLAWARHQGIPVAAFKKGPDYIDPAWLGLVAGRPARNLDSYLMGIEGVRGSFARHAVREGLNVIEGNRGLYDGLDASGTHSTATLARALEAPVLLVIAARKITGTAAALVLGCQHLDPAVRIAGVILNQVATPRQEKVLREAIERACGVPVLGVLPRTSAGEWLPGRHLGLVPPAEHPEAATLETRLLKVAEGRLQWDRILEIAQMAPPIPAVEFPMRLAGAEKDPVTIGYVQDSAFSFYYPDNLEALEELGARLQPVSSLAGQPLPAGLDALYIGGGFPETHASRLSANRTFLDSLRLQAGEGLPIYAECGGLMLLAQAIRWRGQRYAMAGVLPFEVEVCAAPQGHGYVELEVERSTPFFQAGTILRGHEFHYSRIVSVDSVPAAACRVRRGTGCYEGRDGIVTGNVWASYTHLHAVATPEWAAGLIQAARQYRLRGRRR